ncbi:uncharacterized protein [Gossypium hirsutum]|uniref:RNA-directed DNA polymerase homolog n=1 Tax=Gossypium hirsutum TaxID=3635 RepID=A0A1U8L6U3_GOSHI|nr:uncharacterized protein LOC107923412 [Gossypium hirsutum]
MKPNIAVKIREEVRKQFDAGFLQVVNYSEWVAKVVPVPKKDGKVRMCVNYRDLNNASLKENFSLPHIDTLVDNTAGYSLFSFMDGFSGGSMISVSIIYRDENQMADVLATLASLIKVNKQEDMKPIQMSICKAPAHCCNIDEEEERDDYPWYHNILRYMKNNE